MAEEGEKESVSMNSLRPCHMFLALVAAVLFLVTIPTALAAPRKLVMPGKEIAVGFPRALGFSALSHHAVDALSLPAQARINKVEPKGRVGIISLSGRFSALNAGPVEADEAEIAKVCAELRAQNPGVELFCEPNTLFRVSATPNDPRFSELYGLTKIKATTAWNTTKGSASVKVAVIDTGVDYQHADLAANIAKNTAETPGNGIDDDGNGYVDDYYGYNFAYSTGDPMDDDGHGTHCAGTIGARGNDGKGVVGVNWVVGLVPVKALDSTGSGYLSDIAAGIHYALDRNVSVISMSLGGESNSELLEDAIAAAKAKNIVVVVAAGNESANNDVTPSYPANSPHDNVISVAATDSRDILADFSNYGVSKVDVAAPGVDIVSTVRGGYASYSGTSMATPHVAGLAALIKATNPSLTYSQIKSIILRSADKVSSLNGKLVTGARINAAAAVALAAGNAPLPTPVPEKTPTPAPSDPESELPIPGSPDDGSDDWEYKLTLSVKKRSKVAAISGSMTDPDGYGVSDEYVDLVCNGKNRATTVSSETGRYGFRLAKPKRKVTKPVRCYARNIYGERSRSRRVW